MKPAEIRLKSWAYTTSDIYTLLETYSGLTLDRPNLLKLRQWVKDHEIDAVIAYTLDRLSRDPVHFIILQDELEKDGVELILVTETVDSSDLGKLILHIKGFAAKLEAEKIKERTKRGRMQRLREGKLPHGLGKGMLGYDWDSVNKVRKINDYEARLVLRIFNMMAEGNTCFRIARVLNEQCIPSKTGTYWYDKTIEGIIRNQSYMGIMYYGKTKREGGKQVRTNPEEWMILSDASPPIVSKELFEQANMVLDDNKELRRGQPKRPYLLHRRVKCAYCGAHCIGTTLSKRYRYYKCRASYKTLNRPATCNAPYIRADELEEGVWEKVRQVLANPEVIREEIKRQQSATIGIEEIEGEMKELRKRMKSYDAEKRRVTSLFRHGLMEENIILDELIHIENDRKADEKQLKDLNSMLVYRNGLADAELALDKMTGRVIKNLENCSFELKQLALEALSITVIASKEQTEVRALIPVNLTPNRSPV